MSRLAPMETRHASDPEEWLSTGEAAKVLDVPIDTVRRWADDGLLPHRQVAAGRHRRFRRSDVDAFIQSAERAS